MLWCLIVLSTGSSASPFPEFEHPFPTDFVSPWPELADAPPPSPIRREAIWAASGPAFDAAGAAWDVGTFRVVYRSGTAVPIAANGISGVVVRGRGSVQLRFDSEISRVSMGNELASNRRFDESEAQRVRNEGLLELPLGNALILGVTASGEREVADPWWANHPTDGFPGAGQLWDVMKDTAHEVPSALWTARPAAAALLDTGRHWNPGHEGWLALVKNAHPFLHGGLESAVALLQGPYGLQLVSKQMSAERPTVPLRVEMVDAATVFGGVERTEEPGVFRLVPEVRCHFPVAGRVRIRFSATAPGLREIYLGAPNAEGGTVAEVRVAGGGPRLATTRIGDGLLARLPAEAPVDEPVEIEVSVAAMVEGDAGEASELTSRFAAMLPEILGAPPRLDYRQAVASLTTGLLPVAAGSPRRPRIDQGVKWSVTEGRAAWWMVGGVVGNWSKTDDHVHLFPSREGARDALVQELAKARDYYTEQFGPLERDSLVVVQGRDTRNLAFWDATDGMLTIRKAQLSDATYRSVAVTKPNLVLHFLAHEVAHQWWGARAPFAVRHLWLGEGITEWASCVYVRQSAVGEICEGGRRGFDEAFRGRGRAIRVAPALGERVYERGYGLMRSIEVRVGTERLMAALRSLVAEDEVVSPESLARAIVAQGGPDVLADLRYHGEVGWVPDLELTYVPGDVFVELRVGSTVFGTFAVPVDVTCGGSRATHWVTVDEGSGHARVRGNRTCDVELDPDRLVPARKRKTRRRRRLE